MTNKIKTSLILILVISFLLIAGTSYASSQELEITLLPKASVVGDQVRLADIALIEGPDRALKRDLARLIITKSPRPGRSLKIRKDYVTHRLRASGLPLDRLRYNSVPSISVFRQYQAIDQKAVRSIFEEYLSSHEPYAGQEWELARLQTGVLPRLPVGRLTRKIIPGSSMNPGHLTLSIILYVNGREAGQIRASGRINVFNQAIVAARVIERGRIIGVEDIRPGRINIIQIRHALVDDPQKIIGLSSRRRIIPGQPILLRDLKRRTVVRKGDYVIILAESGSIRITDTGRAKQDGVIGKKIAVLNLTSKKVIMAEVLKPSLVKVNF